MEIGIYTKYLNQGGTIKSLTTYHNPIEKQRAVAGACGFRVFQCYERDNMAQ